MPALLSAQDYGLPRYITEEEARMGSSVIYPPPINPIPPSTPVRTMAEWEELDGVIITWSTSQYYPLLRQIVDAAQEEGMVWIICSDSNTVKSYLTAGGVPLYNVSFIIAAYNSVWSRDYGPWCVYTLIGDTLGFVDFKYNRPRPLDDVIPGVLASRWGIPLYQTISGQDSLAHTGGNFMTDGFGTGFASRLIEIENPWHTTQHIDSILFRYCGIQIGRMVKMNVLPYDGIHHIDMHMKMLDEETILVGQYPPGVSDGPQIEANIQYIQNNYQTCYGRPYKIVRIPMPPNANGQYPPNSYYFTYTNSTFVNRTILVPIYGFAQDTTALRIYRENLPGYTVIGYDCNVIIPAGGAIHCINKEIGTRNPVLIAHAKLQNTTDSTNNYPVLANIKNRYGIDSAFVYWRTDTLQPYNRIVMTNSGGQNWTASIPHRPYGTTVYYYIRTRTANGKYFSKPITAPAGYWKFSVYNPVGISGKQETSPQGFALYQNYPNPFNFRSKFKVRSSKFAEASLAVYDILGRMVEVIYRGKLFPGIREFAINGRNLPSGVYFYKLQISNLETGIEYEETRRMVLLK